MDLSDPTRAITPTLDGPVLAVLAAAGKPLTVGQVAQLAARGSEIGIRRSLARLVEQGIVEARLMGRNQVHELNREHVAAEVAIQLSGLRNRLWDKFRKDFGGWKVPPLYASVFGSAARGDGDESSDIDLLLVHPRFAGEKPATRLSSSLMSQVNDAVGAFVTASGESDPVGVWERQVDRLRDLVVRWTGNPLQVVDLSFHEWRHPPTALKRLLVDVERDGIELVKRPTLSLWPSAEPADV